MNKNPACWSSSRERIMKENSCCKEKEIFPCLYYPVLSWQEILSMASVLTLRTSCQQELGQKPLATCWNPKEGKVISWMGSRREESCCYEILLPGGVSRRILKVTKKSGNSFRNSSYSGNSLRLQRRIQKAIGNIIFHPMAILVWIQKEGNNHQLSVVVCNET